MQLNHSLNYAEKVEEAKRNVRSVGRTAVAPKANSWVNEETIDVIASEELTRHAYKQYASLKRKTEEEYAESLNASKTDPHMRLEAQQTMRPTDQNAKQYQATDLDTAVRGYLAEETTTASTRQDALPGIKSKGRLSASYTDRIPMHESAEGALSASYSDRIPRREMQEDSSTKQKNMLKTKGSASPLPHKDLAHHSDHIMQEDNQCYYTASVMDSMKLHAKQVARHASDKDSSAKHKLETKPCEGATVAQKVCTHNKGKNGKSRSVSSKSRSSVKSKCSAYLVDVPSRSSFSKNANVESSSKPSNVKLSNSRNSKLTSSQSVPSTKTRNDKSSTAKTSCSRAASTTAKMKHKRRKKTKDETATCNTQASKIIMFSSARSRLKNFFKRHKQNRNTDETTPMNILNIPVDKTGPVDIPEDMVELKKYDGIRYINVTTQMKILGPVDNPGGVVELNEYDSDRSLTLGTPKENTDASQNNHESDTPVETLIIHVSDESQTGHSIQSSHPKPTKTKKKKSKKHKDDGVKVFDLPWTNGVLYGKYTGPVDTSMRPHGKGSLTITGVWEAGELLTPELNGPCALLTKATQTPIVDVNTNCAQTTVCLLSADMTKYHPAPNEITTPLATSDLPSVPGRNRTRSGSSIKPLWRYHIGQVARSPNDMIIHHSSFDAIDSVAMIRKMDQAFVKRSSGLWTCAVLVERALQPINDKRWYSVSEIDHAEMTLEESMLFVINDDGSTKIINKRNWGKYIRRMKAHQDDDEVGGTDRVREDYNIEDAMEDLLEEDDSRECEATKKGPMMLYGREVDTAVTGFTHEMTNCEDESSVALSVATERITNCGEELGRVDGSEKSTGNNLHYVVHCEKDTSDVDAQNQQHEQDRIWTSAEQGDDKVYLHKNSTSTASTALTWSSLSTSFQLSQSILEDID